MSTVAVDPRIRARRASVARDAGRRRLGRLVFALAAVAAAGLVLSITLTPVLDVEAVDVRGAAQSSEEAILEAAGIAVGDPLAWFDTSDAAEAVAGLPWVDEARVERTWGGEVHIDVTERVAVATHETEDGWQLLDGTGRVLALEEAAPADLPVLEDVGATAVLAVIAAVPVELRPRVGDVIEADGDVVVVLQDGGEVVLGGTEDAPAKLAAAAAVLLTVPDGCVQRLDVSVATAPALVRVAGCQ